MLSLTLSEIQTAQFPVTLPGRPFFGPIETGDGYVNLSIASERTFRNLAAACGRTDWIDDPRFATYPERRANWGTLIDELEVWSRRLTSAEAQAIFDRHGVPASPYRTVREALRDPQLEHRGALAEVRDAGGAFRVMNPPFRFSATQAAAQPHVAALGEHSATVLAELGYTPAEIERLAAAGVTLSTPSRWSIIASS
jgi:formyl-CoA transferase